MKTIKNELSQIIVEQRRTCNEWRKHSPFLLVEDEYCGGNLWRRRRCLFSGCCFILKHLIQMHNGKVNVRLFKFFHGKTSNWMKRTQSYSFKSSTKRIHGQQWNHNFDKKTFVFFRVEALKWQPIDRNRPQNHRRLAEPKRSHHTLTCSSAQHTNSVCGFRPVSNSNTKNLHTDYPSPNRETGEDPQTQPWVHHREILSFRNEGKYNK